MASGLPEPNNEGRAKLAAEPIQNDRGERPSDAMATVVERFDWASTWEPTVQGVIIIADVAYAGGSPTIHLPGLRPPGPRPGSADQPPGE